MSSSNNNRFSASETSTGKLPWNETLKKVMHWKSSNVSALQDTLVCLARTALQATNEPPDHTWELAFNVVLLKSHATKPALLNNRLTTDVVNARPMLLVCSHFQCYVYVHRLRTYMRPMRPKHVQSVAPQSTRLPSLLVRRCYTDLRFVQLSTLQSRCRLCSWSSRSCWDLHWRCPITFHVSHSIKQQTIHTFSPSSQPSVSGDAIRFDGFSEARGQTLYWKLPVKFIGDKVTSYGGNLNYVYRCAGSGQPNRNADVIVRGNNVILHHTSREQSQTDRDNSVSVPITEQSFTRSDGQPSSREDLLMALADVDEILVKGNNNLNDL